MSLTVLVTSKVGLTSSKLTVASSLSVTVLPSLSSTVTVKVFLCARPLASPSINLVIVNVQVVFGASVVPTLQACSPSKSPNTESINERISTVSTLLVFFTVNVKVTFSPVSSTDVLSASFVTSIVGL